MGSEFLGAQSRVGIGVCGRIDRKCSQAHETVMISNFGLSSSIGGMGDENGKSSRCEEWRNRLRIGIVHPLQAIGFLISQKL